MQRKTLTFAEKVEILKKYDSPSAPPLQKDFAKSVGLAESSLRSLLKRKDEILKQAAAASGSKKKRIKTGKYQLLEKILYEWVCELRASKMPISGPIIMEKAVQVAQTIGSEFSPSTGWLDRFKNRYSIVLYKHNSKKLAAAISIEDDKYYWASNVLPEILQNYALNDIYSAAETGLFYKLMPVLKEKKCRGEESRSKESVTILVCANLDGTDKVKLLMIGKSPTPKCFKNVKSFPCDYESQNSAWMTCDIFKKWLYKFDNHLGKQSRKIVLFIDHCPAHPEEVLGLNNIRLEFLPPDSISVFQPMDQGVIKVLKQHYRKRMVHGFLSSIDSVDTQPAINLLDAVHFISAAWDAVKPTTITHCFLKAGFKVTSELTMENSNISIDLEEVSAWHSMCEELREKGFSLEDYIDADDGLATSGESGAADIITDETDSQQEDVVENDSEEESEDDPPPVPTLAEAMEALGVVRRYTCAQDDPFTETIFHLVNKTETELIKQLISAYHPKIDDDYF